MKLLARGLALTLGYVLPVAFYLGLRYLPLTDGIHKVELIANSEQQRLEEVLTARAVEEKFQEERRKLDEQLEKIKRILPTDLANALDNVKERATDFGVELEIVRTNEKPMDDFYAVTRVETRLHGKEADTKDFLDALARASLLNEVEDLRDGPVDGTGRKTLDLTLVLYTASP